MKTIYLNLENKELLLEPLSDTTFAEIFIVDEYSFKDYFSETNESVLSDLKKEIGPICYLIDSNRIPNSDLLEFINEFISHQEILPINTYGDYFTEYYSKGIDCNYIFLEESDYKVILTKNLDILCDFVKYMKINLKLKEAEL